VSQKDDAPIEQKADGAKSSFCNSRNDLHYHINLFSSEEDGGWIADIPDLAHCSAFGESPEEALREVQIAKAAWLDAAEETGKPIPSPQYRPAINQSTS
jgi:predicted RNase H-like HicB family nuclease